MYGRSALRRPFSSVATTSKQYDIVIVGSGPAGLSVASSLRRKLPQASVTVISPSLEHKYQPYWTLVGAGLKQYADSVRPTGDYIPKGAHWIVDSVQDYDPHANSVILSDGSKVKYNHLVVATGISPDYDRIKGFKETLGENGVVSNYVPEGSIKTWEWIQKVAKYENGGTALFTMPSTPIKCAGAAQKIMYLFDDYLARENNYKWRIKYFTGIGKMFGADYYGEVLSKRCDTLGIDRFFQQELVEIKGSEREAIFRDLKNGTEQVQKFDFFHVTPHLTTSASVKRSELANAAGYVEVDAKTLRHVRFPNVWSIGDCSSLPTSKTAAAITSQHPVLTDNLVSVLQGSEMKRAYDGYTSCPLVVSRDEVIMAEFDYQMKPQESTWFDQRTPSKFAFFLKANVFPTMYWEGLLRGTWEGPALIRKQMAPLRKLFVKQ